MSAEEALLENERSALENNQFISHVGGRNMKTSLVKKSGISAVLGLTVGIVIIMFFFMSSNMIPVAIYERLIEETDVQYADAVESKIAVLQQSLMDSGLAIDTKEKLAGNGVEVGYLEGDEFTLENKSGKASAAIRFKGRRIKASDLTAEINSDPSLYDAFNKATYSRAAYYYDKTAEKVFRQIGTSRNNYSSSSNFDNTTSRLIGQGSNINVNNVEEVEKTREEDGQTITYYEYETMGDNASSKASNFISNVAEKNKAGDTNSATLNAANSLNIADTVSKEQRSELFFLAFMENISKMKAGEGNSAKVNEVMNRLYEKTDSQVVDVNTGEVITVSGSMVESPSLYAILSNTPVSSEQAANYSSDRILKLTKNSLGVDNINNETISGAVASTKSNISGSIGRFVSDGSSTASTNVLQTATPIIDSSLVNNSYETLSGISGGELLAEGAVNVGKALARASGATAGSAEAAKSYARLTTSILALDAAVDRNNRSPFDITSKNTFLGSIIYKLATSIQTGPLLTQFGNIGRMFGSAISSLLPGVSADDETERYLANFGDCETLSSIGAVGSVTCDEIATFDSSTLDNIFNDSSFISFVEANTILDDTGTRVIKNNSALADFINYNNNRVTPLGVTDGGIIQSINNKSSSISFLSDILSMVKSFLGTSDKNKQIASGEAFVNSSSNPDWDTYKYAQRYVSLARATEVLRQYSSDKAAYTNVKFFEGTVNPVIAFMESQNSVASK